MEFLDDYDESRPRVVFQSRPKPPSISPNSSQNSLQNKPLLFISLTLSLIFLGFSIFFLHSQILNPLFLWLFLSFLVGPFAPLSFTAGDIRVGQGRIVDFPTQIDAIDHDDDSKKKVIGKRIRGKRSDLYDVNSNGSFDFVQNNGNSAVFEGLGFENEKIKDGIFQEKEWSNEDLGLLRKQLVKYPIGKPRRWEVISEVFKGKHSLESVINKAKGLGKEKPDDSDSYSKFLKDRKAVDKRAEGGNEEVGNGGGDVVVWSSSEDIALLNALKTFPKEVAMRWEKISAAIPGKSKAACVKRVAELKKDFRSSKAN